VQEHFNGKQFTGWFKIRKRLSELEEQHHFGSGGGRGGYGDRRSERDRDYERDRGASRGRDDYPVSRGGHADSRGDRYGDRGPNRYDRGSDRYGDRGGDRRGGYTDRRGGSSRERDRGHDRYGDRGGYGDRYAAPSRRDRDVRFQSCSPSAMFYVAKLCINFICKVRAIRHGETAVACCEHAQAERQVACASDNSLRSLPTASLSTLQSFHAARNTCSTGVGACCITSWQGLPSSLANHTFAPYSRGCAAQQWALCCSQ
jgi:hypothetical protein